MRIRFASLIFAALLFGGAWAQTELSIATGGTGGVYYPYGGGLAELINRYVEGYSAVAEVTGASAENAGLVARGDSDLALALADTVVQAFEGTGSFADQPDAVKAALGELRALGSVYPNAVHIVTLADSGIESIADLEGQRVSVGRAGERHRDFGADHPRGQRSHLRRHRRAPLELQRDRRRPPRR